MPAMKKISIQEMGHAWGNGKRHVPFAVNGRIRRSEDGKGVRNHAWNGETGNEQAG